MSELKKLIEGRRSVRTFAPEELSEQEKQQILDYARTLVNPYGLVINWYLLSAKENKLSVPVITGADTYITGKMKRTEHAEEAFGYVFEKVVLFCQSLNIGTTWIAGTMDRKGFEKAIDLKEDEVMPCVSPLGYIAKKMSFRETMMRKGVKADERLPFNTLFYQNSFAEPLNKEEAGELSDVLEYVRLAPSAVNKQPWRIVICDGKAHFYEQRSKGYVNGEWDIQRIDMGIALCHFEEGLRELGKNPQLEIDDPGIDVPENAYYIASYVY